MDLPVVLWMQINRRINVVQIIGMELVLELFKQARFLLITGIFITKSICSRCDFFVVVYAESIVICISLSHSCHCMLSSHIIFSLGFHLNKTHCFFDNTMRK